MTSMSPAIRPHGFRALSRPYVTLARPAFLLLALVLVADGAAARAWEGSFDAVRTLLALVGLVVLHAAVNVLNEASDTWRGIDFHTKRTPFSGGTGTLPAGLTSVRAAVAWGLILSATGLACGAVLVAQTGTVLVPWIAVGAVLVVGYTDIFARTALGEIASGLGLGLLPVAGVALVQDGSLGAASWAAGIPAFCLTFNLLLLNEFPDEEADRQGGRRNLVLVLGRRGAALVFTAMAVAAPASIAVAVALGVFPAPALLGVIAFIPLLEPIRWALTSPDQPVPIPAMASNVKGILGIDALLAVGLAIAAVF